MNDAISLLLTASLRGDAEAVKACLTTSCVNINHTTSDGNTALTIAACWGHIATVEVLIGTGADLLKGPVSTSKFTFYLIPKTYRHQSWLSAIEYSTTYHYARVNVSHFSFLILYFLFFSFFFSTERSSLSVLVVNIWLFFTICLLIFFSIAHCGVKSASCLHLTIISCPFSVIDRLIFQQ